MYIPSLTGDGFDDQPEGWRMEYTDGIYVHPPEVLALVKLGGMELGKPVRVHHNLRRNGENCSKGKDGCMYVTRQKDSVFYYCHRCHESGRVYDTAMSPEALANRIKFDAKKAREKLGALKDEPKDNLPEDFVFLSAQSVPDYARNWFTKYGVGPYQLTKYDIGWSSAWNRVIIPLYHHIRIDSGDSARQKLIGWVGRDVRELTKEERNEKSIPKYITKKCDKTADRMYFLAQRSHNWTPRSPLIVVEDIISAIKICQAIGSDAMALLNSTPTYHLLTNYRDASIVFWLDGDKQPESLQATKRYSQLGFRTASVLSERDPKEYSAEEIRIKTNEAIIKACGRREVNE